MKGILTFGLTRRPIIMLGLFVFLRRGNDAFTRLNIEAYPNPAPVILEITAQAPGLSAEEMERYYTSRWRSDSIRRRGSTTSGRLHFTAFLCARHIQVWRRFLLRSTPRPV